MIERDGIDKYFVSSDVFQQLNTQAELRLVNEIYGHMYAFRKKILRVTVYILESCIIQALMNLLSSIQTQNKNIH